jgi:hypothetical protein
MTGILAERSQEKRRVGEALIREADNLACQSWSVSGAAPAKASKPAKKPRKAESGQKEMLMPIEGKKASKESTAKKPASKAQRKSA